MMVLLPTLRAILHPPAGGGGGGPAMTGIQFARPDADVSIGSWVGDPVNTAGNRYQNIDEATADDGDFVSSPDNPSSSAATFGLSDVLDPDDDTNHTMRYRYRRLDTGGGSAPTINVTVDLMQGDTVIASNSHSGIGTSWVAGDLTLSGAEAGNITNYEDLRARFTANKSSGSRTSRGEVSWFEFEVPSAIIP
jgi:hypothetical protein